MLIEIIVTSIILLSAVYLSFRNIKNRSKSKCTGCNSCSKECSHCSCGTSN